MNLRDTIEFAKRAIAERDQCTLAGATDTLMQMEVPEVYQIAQARAAGQSPPAPPPAAAPSTFTTEEPDPPAPPAAAPSLAAAEENQADE